MFWHSQACPGDFKAGSSSSRTQKTQQSVKPHFTDGGFETKEGQGLGSHSQQLVAQHSLGPGLR